MERICSNEVGAHVGERVRVAGWLQSLRRLGVVSFLILRDGWGTLQAVAESEAELGPLATGEAGTETVLAVEGRVVRTPEAPGGIELHELQVELISPVTAPMPLAFSKRALKAAVPTLLDHAVVANRHPTRRAVLRLGAGAMAGFRATLGARGFTEIQTPKIVAAATESGANVFKLD